MKNKIITGGTILMLAVTSALGTEHMNDEMMSKHCDACDLYRANELSIDLFGSGSVGKYVIKNPSTTRIKEDGQLGAGVGLTYFMTRNLGIGAEAYSENTTGTFIDSASGNLTLRFPIGQGGLAPYVFGGGGYQFDKTKLWFGQAGAGLEYRFTPKVGLFADGRFVWPTETQYFGVGRLGVRFSF